MIFSSKCIDGLDMQDGYFLLQNTPDSHNQSDVTSKSFELLSFNDLIECASPLSDQDEEFWENFEPKDEAPQIRQKNAA